MSKIALHIADTLYQIEQHEKNLIIDGKHYEIDINKISDNEYSVLINGHSHHVIVHQNQKNTHAYVNNQVYDVQQQTLRDILSVQFSVQHSGKHTATTFCAPMPGLVTKILKQQDASVNEGEGIIVVEAMKMENEIRVAKSGILKKVFVKEKQPIEKGDPLFIIE